MFWHGMDFYEPLPGQLMAILGELILSITDNKNNKFWSSTHMSLDHPALVIGGHFIDARRSITVFLSQSEFRITKMEVRIF